MSSPFSALIGSTDPAMVVVTAALDDARDGCLVGFHSQCSIDPERYAVWLSKANRTYRLALLADRLAVHLLGPEDSDLAELFGATTGDEIDKLASCAWHYDENGAVLVDRLRHHFVGRRQAVIDAGTDHVCFVLEPVDCGDADLRDPLRLSAVSNLDPGHAAQDRPGR
jgi:flavin reductase (DIM6/NTAB) family NADH-FMN oxidoreductase RutF